MPLTIIIDMGDELGAYLRDLGRRAAVAELKPILIEHMAPIVAMEKSILSGHSKSGALGGSLQPRVGTGDRPGTISVFSAATATKKFIREHWGRGRRQQQGWAMNAKYQGNKGGRKAIFYAPFVEAGHRVVKRNAMGQLADTGGRAQPVHFAKGAMDALGDQQADALRDAVWNHILGG
jgi:hypothetical protein